MSVLVGTLGNNSQFVGNVQQQQQEMNAKTKEQLEKEENERLRIQSVAEFPDLISTAYTDTTKFPKVINAMFRNFFIDWHGSKIEVVQNSRNLFVTIHFHEVPSNIEVPEGKYRGIERIIDKDNLNNSESRIAAFNHMASMGQRNQYRLTDAAKQILKDIIPLQFIDTRSNNIKWDKIVSEASVRADNGYSMISVVQVIIDINRLLKVMYGGKVGDSQFQYMVNVGNPINPIPSPAGMIADRWQLFIMRCNTKDVDYLAREYGFRFGNNNGIITD